MHRIVKMLLITLLLLGLASFSNSETCPEKEVMYPCICAENGYTDDIVVKCFPYKEKINLEKLGKIMTILKGKKNVEMILHSCPWSDSNVVIPSDFFSGIHIKRLSFEYCKIHGLTSDNQLPLLGLENDLEVLQIKRSLIAKTEPIVLNFGHLHKLREFYLFKNQIKELRNDWLNSSVSLTRLSLSENGVENIGDRAFANLVHVRELYFTHNPISVQRSLFPIPAPRLETLYLENIGLTTLPENIFSNMPALRSVDLFINNVVRLDQSTWQPVWQQLSDVGLIANPIQCDESMKWIFGVGKSPKVYGKCEDEYGNEMDISDYIESNSQELNR